MDFLFCIYFLSSTSPAASIIRDIVEFFLLHVIEIKNDIGNENW